MEKESVLYCIVLQLLYIYCFRTVNKKVWLKEGSRAFLGTDFVLYLRQSVGIPINSTSTNGLPVVDSGQTFCPEITLFNGKRVGEREKWTDERGSKYTEKEVKERSVYYCHSDWVITRKGIKGMGQSKTQSCWNWKKSSSDAGNDAIKVSYIVHNGIVHDQRLWQRERESVSKRMGLTEREFSRVMEREERHRTRLSFL